MPKDNAYLEAEQKIQQALQSDATELDLNGMGLTELPPELWKLKNLKVLKLGYEHSGNKNQLKEITKEIGQLTQLQKLDLSYNQLAALPESLGQLVQMQWLALSDNQLTALPEWLKQLTQLQSLYLSHNQLTTLPEWLGQLTRLQLFTLANNQLTTLPPSLGQLTQLTELNLSNNQLTTLPDSLGQLTQLTSLHLGNNQLTTLPDALGQLMQLHTLNLSNNQLTNLPDALGQLTQLHTLDLSNNNLTILIERMGQLEQLKNLNLSFNQLRELPESLGQLIQLEQLTLFLNQLSDLPNSICQLLQLEYLSIAANQFASLPNCVFELIELTSLYATDNSIQTIPETISNLKKLRILSLGGEDLGGFLDSTTSYSGDKGHGNKLEALPISLVKLELLKNIELDNNPLNPALQSAYDAGLDELKAYLRSLEQNAEPLYEAKLVLVGEGNVGKTTLLKALKGKAGEAPQEHEPTTHGVEIDIHGLRLPHPAKDGVEIQLNAWDFGGQDVYRVTHQFFFSRRSLYLLVWEPRRGVQQGQVEDWLNMIRLRVGDDARVIIVSTHCKTGERIARIDQPVFKQQYGDMIVGFHEVDSLVPDETTGEMVGIAELKKVIAEHASKLEQMGMGFNRDWKAARDELLARPEPRISFDAFSGVCAARGLSGIDTETLAHLMHDLGYIVHYSDDEKLRDDVILKPEWLTKAIGFVLEDRGTHEMDGVLPDSRLYQVWHDHPFENEERYKPELYPFFLRLMEKYDVSYRLMDGKASLVTQHVPQVRPELPWHPEQEHPKDLRRIAMVCSMEQDPEGLVPWMIVRTHDYATEFKGHRLHWDKGMFLKHGTHGEAFLEKRARELHIYAQGQWPEYFMNIIQNTLERLMENWPGMKDRYRFTVPCPEVIKGEACKGRFNIHALRKFLAEGDSTVRCQECSCKLSITELLMGFEERDMSVQLREIKEQLTGMDSRIANYFMATLRAIADEAKDGPRLFTFRTRETGFSLKPLLSRPLEIQLWCEAEGCQHPIIESDKGVYPIDMPHEWLVQIAPYANFALKVLSTVAPIAAPAINTFFGPKTTETWGIADQLSLASAVIGKLPAEIETSDRGMTPGKILSEPERSGILALHQFLNKEDPTQAKLGLHRVSTYTGDYRWLCQHHYDAWQPNIPDVIPSQ